MDHAVRKLTWEDEGEDEDEGSLYRRERLRIDEILVGVHVQDSIEDLL